MKQQWVAEGGCRCFGDARWCTSGGSCTCEWKWRQLIDKEDAPLLVVPNWTHALSCHGISATHFCEVHGPFFGTQVSHFWAPPGPKNGPVLGARFRAQKWGRGSVAQYKICEGPGKRTRFWARNLGRKVGPFFGPKRHEIGNDLGQHKGGWKESGKPAAARSWRALF